VNGTHIHILGPSGSGTTTLGNALAARIDAEHLDTDDFYWEHTQVRFSEKRSVEHRLNLLRAKFEHFNNWVLSGSLCSWGDPLIPQFSHAVLLQTPWNIREQRLIAREVSRYGASIFSTDTPQGEICRKFLEWAGRYDTAGLEQRSLHTHNKWMSGLPDRIKSIRLDGSNPVDVLVNQCIDFIR
jgi:adenylate kinase family enzyme